MCDFMDYIGSIIFGIFICTETKVDQPVIIFTPMESKKIFVNPSYQVVAHIVLNIALVILYGIFFGQQSVRKYLDKGVIITKQKDTSSSVISPRE